MKTQLLSACAALAISLPTCSNAHDGHSHDQAAPGYNSLRVWRDVTGKPIHEGSFVATRQKELIIQDREGEFVAIELDRLGKADRALADEKLAHARQINTQAVRQTAAVGATRIPANSSPYLGLMQRAFGAFAPKVKTRSDARHFYVESDSIPNHQMMVGITAWQQQVPIPQPYQGANAWRIPLHPVKAAEPMSAKEHFFRGAIALAANGIPIFNPIKNDGRTDTVVAGELDKWGGHCGRADDYHYHIAPTHLQRQVGAGNPVAFALDGYPVFGFTEPDGSPVGKLDWMGGHTGKDGKYHYHAMKTYPYLVGGFRGEVREVGGQVDPQPRAQGVRPYTRPLRGARITGFTGDLKNGYSLKYSQNGRDGFVNYKVLDNGNVAFQFIDSSGQKTSQTFEPRQRGGGPGNRRDREKGDRRRGPEKGKGGQRPPRRDGDRPPPRRPGERSDAQPGRGGPPSDGERKPWIAAHLEELDTDKDGSVSQAEMMSEAAKTFAGYDQNRDGRLSENEYQGRSSVRSAMGGFVRQHSAEFDRDQNKIISREEVDAFALHMFTKADVDRNNIVSYAEANTRNGENRRGNQARGTK